jgi:hypothetical protein
VCLLSFGITISEQVRGSVRYGVGFARSLSEERVVVLKGWRLVFYKETFMHKHLNWVLTASLGLSGLAMVGCDKDNSRASKDSNPAADSKIINNKNDAASVAGSKIPGDQIGTADLTKIYGVLGDTAEAALTKGGLNDLTERLSSTDRDRIGKAADLKDANLDGRVDQLNKDYSGKYNDKFNLDKSKVFENWAKVQKTREDGDKTYANVTIPASHGMPELVVPVVKDHEAWKIDAPDDLTGTQLKSNVLTEVTAIDTTKAEWPSDQLDAQRAMVHHVLAAVMNKPMK